MEKALGQKYREMLFETEEDWRTSIPSFAFDMLYDLGKSLELFSRQEIDTESENNQTA